MGRQFHYESTREKIIVEKEFIEHLQFFALFLMVVLKFSKVLGYPYRGVRAFANTYSKLLLKNVPSETDFICQDNCLDSRWARVRAQFSRCQHHIVLNNTLMLMTSPIAFNSYHNSSNAQPLLLATLEWELYQAQEIHLAQDVFIILGLLDKLV